MPGRSISSNSYRFGFNGKEKDDEWTGSTGAIQDYGMRMYDTRIARFISVDPISREYPELTPYQFASNMPIHAIDLDGLEIYYSQNGSVIGAYGTSTEIRVINEDQLATTTTEFATYSEALKTDPFASNQYLSQTLLTTGSVAYNDYFTSVTDVTNGDALIAYGAPSTYGSTTANCKKAAEKQLNNAGQTQTGPTQAIQTKVDNTTQAANNKTNLTENAIGGSIYIQTQLNKGHAVMVGLEEQNSTGNTIGIVPNYNALTGHFVVINSSTVNASGDVTFGYLDNANAATGMSSGNQFSLDKTSGSMTDSTNPGTGGVSSYEVSEVRKNN